MLEDLLIANSNWIPFVGLVSLVIFLVSIFSILLFIYQPISYFRSKMPVDYLRSKRNAEAIFAVSLLLFAVSFAGLAISADAMYKIEKAKAPVKQVEPNRVNSSNK